MSRNWTKRLIGLLLIFAATEWVIYRAFAIEPPQPTFWWLNITMVPFILAFACGIYLVAKSFEE